MPGTAHAFADDKAVGKRTVIVGAMGADREHFGTAADEQNLRGADMAQELAVDKIRERHTFGQIRPAWRSLFLTRLLALLLILLLRHRRTPPFLTDMPRR